MVSQEGVKMSNVLDKQISDLDTLSRRTSKILAEMEIWKLRDVVIRSKEEFLCVPGFGKESLNELIETLRCFGLNFNMDESSIEDRTELYQTLNKSIANKCADTLRVSFDRIIKKKNAVDIIEAIKEHRKILDTLEQAVLNAEMD